MAARNDGGVAERVGRRSLRRAPLEQANVSIGGNRLACRCLGPGGVVVIDSDRPGRIAGVLNAHAGVETAVGIVERGRGVQRRAAAVDRVVGAELAVRTDFVDHGGHPSRTRDGCGSREVRRQACRTTVDGVVRIGGDIGKHLGKRNHAQIVAVGNGDVAGRSQVQKTDPRGIAAVGVVGNRRDIQR